MTHKVKNISSEPRRVRDTFTGRWVILQPKETAEFKKQPVENHAIVCVGDVDEKEKKNNKKKTTKEDDE